jgi:predicted 2-oxoglutarate/Fe(II)-dependent dioxygenase YbiX
MRRVVRFTIPDFLSRDECEHWIARTEAIGYDAAPITTARGFVFNTDVRNNTRVMFDDPEATDVLWRRLEARMVTMRDEEEYWVPVGLNERLRFYRYETGQVFKWHRDGAFVRSPEERSLLTFMVYLNEGFEGGETEFEEGAVVPHTGEALLFSHALRHQGAPMGRGTKYVLRSDVMFRRL